MLLGARLKAQEELYEQVLDSPVTTHAVDFLARAHLLTQIADLETAKEFIHKPEGSEAARREWDDLNDDDRKGITELVAKHWSLNVNLAVRRLWHAAEVLGFQADTLDPKHVALVAAIYLSRTPEDVLEELTPHRGFLKTRAPDTPPLRRAKMPGIETDRPRSGSSCRCCDESRRFRLRACARTRRRCRGLGPHSSPGSRPPPADVEQRAPWLPQGASRIPQTPSDQPRSLAGLEARWRSVKRRQEVSLLRAYSERAFPLVLARSAFFGDSRPWHRTHAPSRCTTLERELPALRPTCMVLGRRSYWHGCRGAPSPAGAVPRA
jgi:hypothetical protein